MYPMSFKVKLLDPMKTNQNPWKTKLVEN